MIIVLVSFIFLNRYGTIAHELHYVCSSILSSLAVHCLRLFSKARLLTQLNEKELKSGSANTNKSWHNVYRGSAWVYVGGLDFALTEGDVLCVFSQ